MYFYSMLIYEHTHRTAIPNILFIRSSGTQSRTITAEAGTSPSFQEFSTPIKISVKSYLTPISSPFLFEIIKKYSTLFLESILKASNIIT